VHADWMLSASRILEPRYGGRGSTARFFGAQLVVTDWEVAGREASDVALGEQKKTDGEEPSGRGRAQWQHLPAPGRQDASLGRRSLACERECSASGRLIQFLHDEVAGIRARSREASPA
jgi:hypothetical protein